jgi:hypothetical protein
MRIGFRGFLALAASVATAAAAAAPAPSPPAPRPKLTLACERLLPERLRSRWAQGSTVQTTYSEADHMNCELVLPGRMPLSASYTCRGGPYDAQYWAEYKKKLPKGGAAETVKVGTGAVYWSASAAHTVRFADRETGCLVTVTAFGLDKRRAIAFAADVERELTLESAM